MIDKSVRTGDVVGSIISTGNVSGNIFVSSKNSIANSEQRQTLAEAADEIQRLLKQLEKTNPSANESDKVAYVTIAAKPDLKQRAIAAIKEGSETVIEEFFLEDKYLKVAKAVVKGWLQAST
jgi:cell division protein ZapA (FtsZ GTPase activity inhibitor)